MNNVAIIGDGPIGLYLAYKLRKKGIKCSLYDPRTGIYTRPGHVNEEDMRKVNDEIGKNTSLPYRVHLKDIERTLYEEIKYYNIPAERKSFVRFNNDPKKKGIIVCDEEGKEEVVECDFVFDCTGSRRALVSELNASITPSPFTIKPISNEINVRNNFLAYVKMKQEDFNLLRYNTSKLNDFTPHAEQPLAYAKSMEQLRALGWKEFGFPKCYGMDFRKNKVCLYLETPDNLPEDRQNEWVHAVLRAMTHDDKISFQQLPSQNKTYGKKPRFNPFYVDPQVVEEVAYESKGLPTVIIAGDAQIEPHYALAHGLKTGMERVDRLIKHIEEYNGTIAYFDAKEYADAIKTPIKEHKERVFNYYRRRETYFAEWLKQAEIYYERAMKQAYDQPDLVNQFTETLKEIKARLSYRDIAPLFSSLYNKNGTVPFDTVGPQILNTQLTAIYDRLINVLTDLPVSFLKERTIALEHLKEIANIWKDLGSEYFRKHSVNESLKMYQASLNVYQTPLLVSQCALQELTLLSNIVICKRKLKSTDAIQTAQDALDKYPTILDLAPIKRKILDNLLTEISEHLKKKPAFDTRQLTEIHDLLIHVFAELPEFYSNEQHTIALEHLKTIANIWKELGSEHFKKHSLDEALKMYQASLNVYQTPLLANQCALQELTLLSNMVICKRKLNQSTEAIQTAKDALDKYPSLPELAPIKRKILDNLLTEISAKLKRIPAIDTPQLTEIQKLLTHVFAELPEFYSNEQRTVALEHLKTIANSWKELGSEHFKKHSLVEAEKMYQASLNVYQTPLLANQCALQELTLLSNMVICKRKLNQSTEAIQTAKDALDKYPTLPELAPIKRKILDNLLTEISEQLKRIPAIDTPQLTKIQNLLTHVFVELPEFYSNEQRTIALEHLKTIANSWKELGSEHFKKHSLVEAEKMYQASLNVYQTPLLANQCTLQELTLLSNMVICKRKLNQSTEAIQTAKDALDKYPTLPELAPIKRKILDNLLTEISEHLNRRPTLDTRPLTEMHDLLLHLFVDQPQSFSKEQRTIALEHLKTIAHSWKELGTEQFKQRSLDKAEKMYQASLNVYQTPLLANQCTLEQLTLLSNIVICKRKLNKSTEAMQTAKNALDNYPTTPELLIIKGKILGNLLSEISEQLKTAIKENASLLKKDMQQIVNQYSYLIDENLEKDVRKNLNNQVDLLQEVGFFKHQKNPVSANSKEMTNNKPFTQPL